MTYEEAHTAMCMSLRVRIAMGPQFGYIQSLSISSCMQGLNTYEATLLMVGPINSPGDRVTQWIDIGNLELALPGDEGVEPIVDPDPPHVIAMKLPKGPSLARGKRNMRI